jgi:formate hydrogenlyase subunit 4
MSVLGTVLHLLALAVLPTLLIGVLNRTRALWAGRRGPGLLQAAFDLWRLARKQSVYSRTTTELFRLGPLVMLACVLVSALLVPVLGRAAPISFAWDFVALAYLWGLGRLFLVLSALDTGSPFEGMGASREATWGALLEPALFLALGSLAAVSGQSSLAGLLEAGGTPLAWVVRVSCAGALLIMLQVEASRVPVDDPATHLELTMIHEVMVLDHAGPELAALQLASSVKLLVCTALIAGLLNPVSQSQSAIAIAAAQLGLMLGIAVVVGCIESLTARLKLASVPKYLALAAAFGLFALLIGVWERGGR